MRTAKEIAKHNDLFRTTMIRTKRHQVVMTHGVAESQLKEQAIGAVRAFKDFSKGNDPNEEHDFGSFEINGEKFFWKIDYYDSKFEYGADPYNDQEYSMVLTIMFADEY